MKCPIAKCKNEEKRRCNIVVPCCLQWLIKDLRRAQRLIREVPELMAKHGYSEQYRRWTIRAVEIGAMKESK